MEKVSVSTLLEIIILELGKIVREKAKGSLGMPIVMIIWEHGEIET